MGSPFGALAPAHFFNHAAAGVISNILTAPVRPRLLSVCDPEQWLLLSVELDMQSNLPKQSCLVEGERAHPAPDAVLEIAYIQPPQMCMREVYLLLC